LLKGPAFSRKRWHYSLYMEQLVAGTTYFLRHVLALFSFSVAACCQTVLLSSASVGTTFSTWSGLLLEGPAFSRKRFYMEQRVAGRTCFLRQALALCSLHGTVCCWKDLLSPASVGTTLSTWNGLLLEGPAFSRKRWHYVLYMRQCVAGRTCFLRQVFALHSLHGAVCCWKDPLSAASVGTMFSTWSSVLLEGTAFSGKRWHYILYMERLVAGRICFFRQALALHCLHGVASCWNYPISSASVGTIFLTWICLLLELRDFFSKLWHYILDME